MKTKLSYVIGLLGLIIIISLALKIHNTKKNLSDFEGSCYNALRSKIILESKNENYKIWRDLEFDIWLSSFNRFGQIEYHHKNNSQKIAGGLTIVYWFNQKRSCSVCIEEDMDILKELIDSIGENSFLVISNFRNNKEIELFERKYSLSDVCYNVKEGELIRKLNQTPFVRLLFIINEKKQILYPIQIETGIDLTGGAILELLDYFNNYPLE
ncbi:MAG: hypothetical protein U9N86_12200 [Bacteroidota bacterium]|nr:hypothetical protein [Bacteroidota bacterium]